MANKIYIKPLFESATSENKTMVFPLTEDIAFDVSSDLASWSDMVPGIELLGKIQQVKSGFSGQLSDGLLNLQNMFDAPRWEKTNPIEFTVSLGFYLIDDAYKNIFKPMKELMGYSILSRDKKGNIIPPGLFLPAASATRIKGIKDKDAQSKASSKSMRTAKLISLKIPGILSMQYAMIKSTNPVFSKHITESGFPLWGTLELNIVGVRPAFDTDFNGDQYGGTIKEALKKEEVDNLGAGGGPDSLKF